MKKLFSILILIVVWYLLLIFLAPNISDKIDSIIWLNGLTKEIKDIKSDLDKNSVSDLSDAYSWAIKKIDETKGKIDDIRSTANEVEKTYNQVSDTVESVKKTVDNISN